MVQAAHFYCC
ncbi:hypothetical protein ECEC4421_0866, partial [Escherichia coli EC4421]